MIKDALLMTGKKARAQWASLTDFVRGDIACVLTAADLVEFGRCPRRWLMTEPPEEPAWAYGPGLTELMVGEPGDVKFLAARRPDTYEALIMRCPKCNSQSTGKLCRKCGVSRRNVVEPRPWTGSAKQCQGWTEKHEGQGLKVIPPAEYDRCVTGANNVLAQPALARVLGNSETLIVLTATWYDEATQLEIPLLASALCLPKSGDPLDNSIIGFVETRNADPRAWELGLVSSGLALESALTLTLAEQAIADNRTQFLWLVVERDLPRLVCRRRASPEILDLGRTGYNALLAAYCQCLMSGEWPSFEPPAVEDLNSWAVSHVEPWMTGQGPSGGFFAPEATTAMVQRKADAKAKAPANGS